MPIDIVWLDQPACHDRTLVGGKAANLSCLFHEFRIPNGFCLTAQAFTRLAASDPGMLGHRGIQLQATTTALIS